MAELSVRHQALIQALLSRGPLSDSDFHRIFKGLTGKTPATHQKVFDDYLLKINKALSYVQFELRCCRHQYDGKIYYGVINNVSDEQSKLGTTYSVPQIAFYKAIIEAIVADSAAKGCISEIEAFNLQLENQAHAGSGSQSQADIPSLKNFSFSQKEKTLRKLLNDQWLNHTSDGNIGLGIQSFLDLRSWFRNNEVPPCEACNEAGVKAELCQNENCTARIHQYCLKNFFSQRKGGRICPRCSSPWKSSGPKAETVEEEEDDEPIITTARKQERTKLKRTRARANDETERVEEDEDDEPIVSTARKQERAELKRKRARANYETERVEEEEDGEPLISTARKQERAELKRKRARANDETECSSSGSAPTSRPRRLTRRSTNAT